MIFYHIAFPDGRKEKGVLPLMRKKAEKTAKSADPRLVGMSPDEKICKGEL